MDEEDAYLRESYDKQPVREIAAAIGRTEVAIWIRANKLGLKALHRTGINSLVKGYFKTVDTPVKAYLLGLLTADGWISPKNQVGLALGGKDRELVELLRDELVPGARIGHYKTREGRPMARVLITSADLATDLAKHGMVPAKTLITFWPPGLPSHLENSYICGYFDGDGSLDPRWVYRWTIVGGNEPFLVTMQDKIEVGCGVRPGGPYRDKRHKHAWSIVTTGKPVRVIDTWLHQDVPGLARKRLP